MAGRPRRRARLARLNASQGHPWLQDSLAKDLARRLGLSVDETILTDVASVKRFLQAQRYGERGIVAAPTVVLYPSDRYPYVVETLIRSDGAPLADYAKPPGGSGWKVMFVDDEDTTPFVAALMAYGGGPLSAPAVGLPMDRGPWSFPTLYLPYSGKLWGELG